jgi:hypothetical protein
MPRRRITAASAQNRDAARPLPRNPHRARRPIRLAWADPAYTGSRLARWTVTLKMTLCIAARRDLHARAGADAKRCFRGVILITPQARTCAPSRSVCSDPRCSVTVCEGFFNP